MPDTRDGRARDWLARPAKPIRYGEQAVNWSTFLAIGQIAMNGATADLSHGGLVGFFSYVLPARWGLAAAASSINLRKLSPGVPADGLWRHTTGQWRTDLIWLGLVTGALFAAALWRLARKLNRPE